MSTHDLRYAAFKNKRLSLAHSAHPFTPQGTPCRSHPSPLPLRRAPSRHAQKHLNLQRPATVQLPDDEEHTHTPIQTALRSTLIIAIILAILVFAFGDTAENKVQRTGIWRVIEMYWVECICVNGMVWAAYWLGRSIWEARKDNDDDEDGSRTHEAAESEMHNDTEGININEDKKMQDQRRGGEHTAITTLGQSASIQTKEEDLVYESESDIPSTRSRYDSSPFESAITNQAQQESLLAACQDKSVSWMH